MSSTVNRRNNPCQNEQCGGTIYEAGYEYTDSVDTAKPIWRCMNCHRETPRHTRHRPTNKALALKAWSEIKAEWKQTDEELHNLNVAGKIKSGAIMVHGATFNYNLDKLLMTAKPSRWDVKYHSNQARRDLEKAKLFVKSHTETV